MNRIEKMKDIVTNHLKAFSRSDWKAYSAIFSDGAIYEEEATGRRVQGVEEIVRCVEPWMRAFPDLQARIKDTVVAGDALVAELEWTGTHKGPLAGPFGSIPPTGKAGKLLAVEVVRFDGDRIREIRHYFDLLSLLRQLGVAPEFKAGAATSSSH